MQELVGSIVTGLGGTIFGGILEGVSDRKFNDHLKEFQENLRLHRPDANHDIVGAIHRSYLQATLQSCARRGESLGVDVQQCVLKESFQGAVTAIINKSPKANHVTTWAKLEGKLILTALKNWANSDFILLSSAQTEEDRLAIEIHWLDRVATATRQKIKDLDSGKSSFENFDFAPQPELLVQPEYPTAKERVTAIRAELLNHVLGAITAEFGAPSVAFVCLLNDGWLNETGIQQDWFTLFCACFQYQLKHDDTARAAFQNNVLAQLKIDGQAVSFDVAKQQLEKMGGDLCRKLDEARDVLLNRHDQSDQLTQARFDELLPLLALTRDLHSTVTQLPELIWQEGVKTRDAVDNKGDQVIAAVQTASEANLAALKEAKEAIDRFEQQLAVGIVRPVRQSSAILNTEIIRVANRRAKRRGDPNDPWKEI